MPDPDQPDSLDRVAVRSISAVLVTAHRCHFCRDARDLLLDLSHRYPLSTRSISLESTEGTAIASRFHIPFPPALLLNGEYFGHGRISKRKLTKALDAIQRAGATQ